MSRIRTHITDHAVLRYLELVQGVDVEAVRREIGRAVNVDHPMPGASGIVAEGVVFKLGERDGELYVTTVWPRGGDGRR